MPKLSIAIYGRKSRFNARSESVSTQITPCRERFNLDKRDKIEDEPADQDAPQ